MSDLRRAALAVVHAWDTDGPVSTMEDLRAALAQPEQEPEPLAWRYDLMRNGSFAGVSTEYSPIKLDNIGSNWTPLYTAPPQRKPLTEEEIAALSEQHIFASRLTKFVRTIEKAHGIGGEK